MTAWVWRNWVVDPFRRSPVFLAWAACLSWGLQIHGYAQVIVLTWSTALLGYLGASLAFSRAYEADASSGRLDAQLAAVRARWMATVREFGRSLAPIIQEMNQAFAAVLANFAGLAESIASNEMVAKKRREAIAIGIEPEAFDAMVEQARDAARVTGAPFERLFRRGWDRLLLGLIHQDDRLDALQYALGHRQIPERPRKVDG